MAGPRRHSFMCLAACLALTLGGCTSDEIADPAPRDPPAVPAVDGVRRAVTVKGIREHLVRLARIAERSGGNRASGTSGYRRSLRYVSETLSAAGYDVRVHRFRAPIHIERAPSTLEVEGAKSGFEDGADLKALLYSPSGNVKGRLFGSEASFRGACDMDALADVPQGSILLLERSGLCYMRDQVINAGRAGAVAVLFSMDAAPGVGLLRPTLISPAGIEIPALAVTRETATELAQKGAVRVHVRVNTRSPLRDLESLIADSPQGDPLSVVMAGGHLDSVVDGPGINDNGSGVATLLEIAEEMAGRDTEHKIRFAFWAGEEYGLLGSSRYVDELSTMETRDIAVYLNFDMLASPNHVPWVYDDSTAPEGSDRITDLFMRLLDDQGVQGELLDLQGRSDHMRFEQEGIPIGGLFSGAEENKTMEQSEAYGGAAGKPFDSCYHQPCDDIGNIDENALAGLADAAAAALATLADRADEILEGVSR